MSAATTPVTPIAPVVPVPAANRGTTAIAERVMRKIAAYSASRGTATSGATAKSHGVRGAGKVRAQSHNRAVAIQLNLRVAYPHPAAAVAHAARWRVITELERITGHAVTGVEIVVEYER